MREIDSRHLLKAKSAGYQPDTNRSKPPKSQLYQQMLQFSKYQGLGNDFLIVEGRQGQLPDAISNPDPAWVRRICDASELVAMA